MGALVGAALRVNDLPLPLLDLNLSAQSSFSKIVLSPREDRGWEKYFPLSHPYSSVQHRGAEPDYSG